MLALLKSFNFGKYKKYINIVGKLLKVFWSINPRVKG